MTNHRRNVPEHHSRTLTSQSQKLVQGGDSVSRPYFLYTTDRSSSSPVHQGSLYERYDLLGGGSSDPLHVAQVTYTPITKSMSVRFTPPLRSTVSICWILSTMLACVSQPERSGRARFYVSWWIPVSSSWTCACSPNASNEYTVSRIL